MSLDVRDGEIVGLMGPNGSGKTTLLNVISGFYRPNAGQVRLAGRDVAGAPAHVIAGLGVARTFQTTILSPRLTVLASVLAGCHRLADYGLAAALLSTPRVRRAEAVAGERATWALALVGLTGSEDAIASALPYGQQRLVELARAIAARPRLLLLDEPAAGFSSAEIGRLASAIDEIRRSGITVVLVEHHVPLVMSLADRVVVLDYGRRIAEGAPAEVRANAEVIAAYLGDATP